MSGLIRFVLGPAPTGHPAGPVLVERSNLRPNRGDGDLDVNWRSLLFVSGLMRSGARNSTGSEVWRNRNLHMLD